MLKFLLSALLAASMRAHAQVPPGTIASDPPQVAPTCEVDGQSWDNLLQDFISGWNGDKLDLCEYKRFVGLNRLISVDMRLNETQYNARMAQLYAFNDKSEAVNWLVMNFIDTWAGILINANLEKEYSQAQSGSSGTSRTMLSVTVISLLVPYMKKFSAFPVRFLRVLLNDLYVSEGELQTSLADHLVRPPLVRGAANDLGDRSSRDAFMKNFKEEMIAAGSGAWGGWLAAHGASWGIGLVFPSWTIIFNRANISRTKFIDWAKPPVLIGLMGSFVVADMVATGTDTHQFLDRVDKARGDLLALADDVMNNISPRNELQIWRDMEKIKGAIVTQNYLMTKTFMEDVSDAVEHEKLSAKSELTSGEGSRQQILAEHRAEFKARLVKLIKKNKRNLDAALDITQSTQLALSRVADPMTAPLLTTIQQFSMRDRLLMDSEVMTESIWRSVEAELNESQL